MIISEHTDYLGYRDVDDEHMKAFYNCMELSGSNEKDTERQSLFFILTHNKFYRNCVKKLYDFKDNCINLEIYES